MMSPNYILNFVLNYGHKKPDSSGTHDRSFDTASDRAPEHVPCAVGEAVLREPAVVRLALGTRRGRLRPTCVCTDQLRASRLPFPEIRKVSG